MRGVGGQGGGKNYSGQKQPGRVALGMKSLSISTFHTSKFTVVVVQEMVVIDEMAITDRPASKCHSLPASSFMPCCDLNAVSKSHHLRFIMDAPTKN